MGGGVGGNVGAAASAGVYPRELERAVVLRDGSYLRIRPIRPDDEPRLVDLYGRLSEHTAYQRFFTLMRRLPPSWFHFFANVDYRNRLALVAERDQLAAMVLRLEADKARLVETKFVTSEQAQDLWKAERVRMLDLLETAWSIIANVSESNWQKQSSEWCDAVYRFRDEYFTQRWGVDAARAAERETDATRPREEP